MRLLVKGVIAVVLVVGVAVTLALTCPDEQSFKRWAAENIPPDSGSVVKKAQGRRWRPRPSGPPTTRATSCGRRWMPIRGERNSDISASWGRGFGLAVSEKERRDETWTGSDDRGRDTLPCHGVRLPPHRLSAAAA